MKTRHSSPYVRCHALECLKVTVEELGEEYMTQLPESIPFLTELLEGKFIIRNLCRITQVDSASY